MNTIIKKIRAEIERLRELNAPKDSDNKIDEIAGQGYDDCLDDVENFLDTLQEPEVDFEEEADRMFFSLGWYEGDHHQPMLDCVSLEQFRGIARHFAQWGADHTPLPEDTVAFNKGVEEGKRLMMEEAEPAEIGYFNHRGLSILTEKSIERMPVSEGDKVRIIVLPKED